MKSVEVPATICPGCGKRLDGSTDPFRESVPSEGSFSVCMYCQNVSVFRADQTLRPMTAREWETMPTETRRKVDLIKRAIERMPPR